MLVRSARRTEDLVEPVRGSWHQRALIGGVLTHEVEAVLALATGIAHRVSEELRLVAADAVARAELLERETPS